MGRQYIFSNKAIFPFLSSVLCFVSSATYAEELNAVQVDNKATPKESAVKATTSVETTPAPQSIANSAVSTDALAAIREAIQNSNYKLAYQSALVIKSDYEGDPEYDFLFGLAALETGEFHEAVFALERVVTSYPDQLRARLELGRAYYATHNYAAAKKEFNLVLEQNPPENVKQNVLPFLTRIDLMENSYKSSFNGYIGFSGGYDSNINGATSANNAIFSPEEGLDQIEVPLGDDSKEIDDTYSNIVGGFGYLYPFSKRSAIVAKLSATQRNNLDSDTYDMGNYGIETTYLMTVGQIRSSYGFLYQSLKLNSADYQDSYHLVGNWGFDTQSKWQFATNLTLSDIRYPEALSDDRDIRQLALFTSVSKEFLGLVHTGSFIYSNSNTKTSDDESNGKDSIGWSYTGMKAFGQSYALYYRFLMQTTENDDLSISPYFGELREDDQMSNALGWQWLIFKGFSFRTEFSYTKNDSNIELYEYDRTKLDLGIRYQL